MNGELVRWELINPSDAYTFLAPNTLIAECAVLLLGQGAYGANPEEGSGLEQAPLFLLGGAEEWFKEQGIDSIVTFIAAHRAEIADALDSFMIGDLRERKAFNRLINTITDPVEREKARLAFHDEKRSSMNNIGAYAWKLAMHLRATAGLQQV